MARYFKKRKTAHGPNKNEQKVLRAQDAAAEARRGVLGARFPVVSALRLRLTFLDTRQTVLAEKLSTFGPKDAASFVLECPGRCGRGTFDLLPLLTETVAAGLTSVEKNLKCQEGVAAGSAESCGCEAKVRFEIDYSPASGPVANG